MYFAVRGVVKRSLHHCIEKRDKKQTDTHTVDYDIDNMVCGINQRKSTDFRLHRKFVFTF